MDRRNFIQSSTLSSLGLIAGVPFKFWEQGKTHLITLSFDDGFRKSFLKTADIYESVGLKACFNVIASGHLPDFKAPDDYILPELMGSFEDWNQLVKRGHEVMPHSWKHSWLNKLPTQEASALIDQCIDYFVERLDGFDPSKAVFNFPFNATTPELNQHTLTRVGALRAWGNGDVNPMPDQGPEILGCSSNGPDNIDRWVKAKIKRFLKSSGGWLIINLHGLDGEGWGHLSSKFLEKLLNKLVKMEAVAVVPTGQALFA
ncbi:MAG: polysaccharide deacetylase family protein [Bacteroidota bacterium]